MRIHLLFTVTDAPDLGGPHYYVQAGNKFDPLEYAKARKLDATAINPHDVFDISFALATLKPWQWLVIVHEPPEA
jgi:hypothetical protein